MNRLILALAALGFSAAADAANALPAYHVVSDDTVGDVRKVSVRLDSRAGEADLKAVADAVRAKKAAGPLPQIVTFYLPVAKLSDGPWADVRFDPTAKVTIRGLRADEEQAYRAEAASDSRPLIGVWLTSPPAIPGKLSIWREKSGKIFAEWHVRSGQKTVDELIETGSQRGRRFEISGSSGGYYLALWNGALELGEKAQMIAVADRLTIEAPKAAKGPDTPQLSSSTRGTVAAKPDAGAPSSTAAAASLTQPAKPAQSQKPKDVASKRKPPAGTTASNAGGGIPSVFGSN